MRFLLVWDIIFYCWVIGAQHFETVSGFIFKHQEVVDFTTLEYETRKYHPTMCRYAPEE